MATVQRPIGQVPTQQTGPQIAQLVQSALNRLQAMANQGIPVDDSNEEARKIKAFLAQYRPRPPQQQVPQPVDQQQQQQQQHPHPLLNGNPAERAHSLPPGLVPPSPSPPPNYVFTDAQRQAFQNQYTAWKYVSRNMALPEQLQNALRAYTPAQDIQNDPQVRFEEDMSSLEHDSKSIIYPYNAYTTPSARLSSLKDTQSRSLSRVLVPTIFPSGLDPHSIMAERNKFIQARIDLRIKELSDMTSTLEDAELEPPVTEDRLRAPSARPTFPNPSARAKLRALIELKGLKLRHKQKVLRAAVAEKMAHSTALPTDCTEFRRPRKPTLRDARSTEAAERKQRLERERKAKQKHIDYLGIICAHGQNLLNNERSHLTRVQRLGKAVAKFHQDTEREEQKRIERVSRERLKALKNDDEEAYLKLIDTAKDTRITHLLKQTDSYLDNLADAVRAQQAEAGMPSTVPVTDFIEGPVDETAFGASKQEDPEDKGKADYYRVAHRINERITSQPGILVGGQLKEYQLKGLQWMVSLYNNRLNGILADEMGLGKTIQTISLISFLVERKKELGPYLVIVPLSTLTNWTLEFAKWVPSLKVISYKGAPNVRRNLQNELRGNFHVLLTTYEYIIKDRPVLCKHRWTHMIIDEGHRMKNTNSRLSQTLTQFYSSRYRLILTGTPLQNNLPELWALLNFALPKVFNSVQSFDEWFNTPFANTGGGDKIELNEEEALLVIRRLHKVLRPFLLRRLKKDVEADLPDKTEKVIKVPLSGLQQRLYYQMQKFGMIPSGNGKGSQIKGLQNVLMQYRKICQHPYLFDEVESAMTAHGHDPIISLVRTSGKVELCDRILPKLFASGHRVLMFFQMTKVMDIMEDYLRYKKWEFLRLDGSTKPEDRSELLAKFNAPNSPYNIFLLSTRAGGLGLNLQTADTVILYDSDWNPHADLQAQDRAHRIGQTKAVRIYRFVTEKSIEESMLARARNKLNIDEKVIQAGKFDNKSTAAERENILRMLIEGDQEDTEESGVMNDDELNEILARSEEEANLFFQIDKDRARAREERAQNGGYVSDLITVEELPAIYRSEDPPRIVEEDVPVGRGHRRRNNITYDENMTEGDFIKQISGYYTDEEPAPGVPPPPLSTSRNPKPKPDSDSEAEEAPKNRRAAKNSKRKRPPKQDTPSIIDDEEEEERPAPKRRKTGGGQPKEPPLPQHIRDQMRAIMQACQRAVQELIAPEDGRSRADLFKELPSRQLYADYYALIKTPIAISTIRKRVAGTYYKNMQTFKDDWHLMFSNAMTYNQEGSYVYNNAVEMRKVFDETFDRLTAGVDLPGLPGASNPHASGTASLGNTAPPSTSYAGSNPPVEGLAAYSAIAEPGQFPTPPPRRVKRRVIASDDEDYNQSGDSD